MITVKKSITFKVEVDNFTHEDQQELRNIIRHEELVGFRCISNEISSPYDIITQTFTS